MPRLNTSLQMVLISETSSEVKVFFHPCFLCSAFRFPEGGFGIPLKDGGIDFNAEEGLHTVSDDIWFLKNIIKLNPPVCDWRLGFECKVC